MPPLRNLVFAGARATNAAPTVDKVRSRNVRTNPVGGGAHDAPQVSLQCSHKQKAPSGRELAPQRLMDCKSLEFAGKKKKKIVLCQVQPLRRAKRGTSPYTGEAQGCAADCKVGYQTAGAYGMPPTELDFRQIGASWAPPPTGFARISERGTLPFVDGGVCRFATTHILPPDVKLLFPFRY